MQNKAFATLQQIQKPSIIHYYTATDKERLTQHNTVPSITYISCHSTGNCREIWLEIKGRARFSFPKAETAVNAMLFGSL
jgi:mannose-6-phosphate isomerase-like protein (cupin superfamily)